MPILTIARLTILEASRRKLLLAVLVLTLAVIALTGWGFDRLWTIRVEGRPITATEVRLATSQVLILVVFMYSFVLALTAALLAAPAIAGDVESGVVLAMVARPIRRSDLVLGRWLGMAVLVVGYAAGSGVAEMAVVNQVTGYLPPEPGQLIVYVAGQGVVLLTLAVLLSTRLAAITGGAIALFTFLMGWLAGVVGSIGVNLGNSTLEQVGTVGRFLLPTDGLWRGAIYSMEPAAELVLIHQRGVAAASNPFAAVAPPPPAYLAWSLIWVAVVLALGVYSFRRRQL